VRVVLDRTVCSGHALCNAVAPEVYELDDEGFCLPLPETIPDELADAARKGVSACPEQALRIEDR
jgi:ferredoxin